MNQKDVAVKAFSDIGTALNIKDTTNGLYHYFLAVENTGATGSAPEQLDLNVVGSMNKLYVAGKKDNPAKEITFFGTRDNFAELEKMKGKNFDFLQTNPDGCGFSFSGTVNYWQDDVTSGAIIKGKIYITVTKEHRFINNCYDLLEDLAFIDSEVPTQITVKGTGTQDLNLETYPADATITATTDTATVATVATTGKKVTVTGVANGNAIITLEAKKEGFADRKQTFTVFVVSADVSEE